jgi:hypothetical protein
MSIESIIIIFSLALLSIIIIFFVAGLIYSKINKSKLEEAYVTSINQKNYVNYTTTQVGFSKYSSPARLTNIPVYNQGISKNFPTRNYNFNGHTHPAHRSYYTVFKSSQQTPYLNNQRVN